MPAKERTLTHQQAKSFYDRLGSKQDLQAFYEAPATRDLIAHAAFETAHAVFEFGCGTGAFARQVLTDYLSHQASYLAVDSSSIMVELAQNRLALFGDRVTVRFTDGTLLFDEAASTYDRFVANYVLDLLSASDIVAMLTEAHRLLAADGRLCLVSLAPGSTRLTRLVTGVWKRVHTLSPSLVGGCRPIELLDFLPGAQWQKLYVRVITSFGIPSEVLVAAKRASEQASGAM